MKYFNDYLNLKSIDLRNNDIVIFYGDDNVGKSSYINFINKQHDYILDEIWKISHLLLLYKVKRTSKRVLVGSRLSRYYFFLFFLFFNVKFFDLNKSSTKIKNELERRNVDYNEEAIAIFLKKYNASYFELNSILEKFPSSSFTYSLKMYLHKEQNSKVHREDKAA